MNAWRWERWAGPAGGIIFIVLQIISGAMFHPPATKKPAAEIARYFLNHHKAGVVATVLGVVSTIAFLWLAGALAMRLWQAGEQRLAATGFGGALIGGALANLGYVAQGALVHRSIIEGDAATTKALYDLESIAFVFIWAPMVALAAATAIAVLRSEALPRWYGLTSGAGAIVLLSGSATILGKGFYAPVEVWNFVTFIVFLAWTLLTSYVVWQSTTRLDAAPQTPG